MEFVYFRLAKFIKLWPLCPYLSVSVLDGGDVGVSEGAFDEAEDER